MWDGVSTAPLISKNINTRNMKRPGILNEIKFKEMSLLEKVLAGFVLAATLLLTIAAIAAPPMILIIPFQVLVGVITWRISGGFTPILYKLLMYSKKKEKGDYFIWKPKEERKENMFLKSLTASLLPTAILLFMIANVARIFTLEPNEEGRISILSNSYIFLLFIFPSAFTYFVVPVGVFLGSDLKKYDRNTLEVFSVGKITRIRMTSIGGVLAILIAVTILYFEYQGQLGSFAAETLLIFLYSYFTIFWTCYVYFKKYYPRHLTKLKEYIAKDGIRECEVGFRMSEEI